MTPSRRHLKPPKNKQKRHSAHPESVTAPTINYHTQDDPQSLRNDSAGSTQASKEPRKVLRRFFAGLLVLVLILLIGIAINLGVVLFGGANWNDTPLGRGYNTVRHMVMDAEGKTEKTPSGDTLFVQDPNKVREFGYGNIKYAPAPKKPFRNAKCNMLPLHEVTHMSPNSWRAPSINAGSDLVINGDRNHAATIPDAPTGVIKGDGMRITDTHGAMDIAGHVDYGPGAKSAQGGELSQFGQLRNLSSCDHMYVSDDKGNVHELVVTDLYTKDQTTLKKEEDDKKPQDREFFRDTGPFNVFFFTCSGPSVSDAGGAFQFNYRDNLITKTSPVAEK